MPIFYGCVYRNPEKELSKCRKTTGGAPFDLTRTHLNKFASMLVGLPIRVEHADSNVGEIIGAEQDRETGSLFVAFKFDNTLGGIAAREYVSGNATSELSLRHDYYPGLEHIKPVEVSIVKRGARPDTNIIVDPYVIYEKGLFSLLKNETRNFKRPITIMASDQTAPVVPATPTTDEPQKKKARMMNADFAQSIADKLTQEEARELFSRFTESGEAMILTNKRMKEIQSELQKTEAEKVELQRRLEKEEKNNEATSEEIVTFLNRMRECTQQTPIRDALRESFNKELSQSPFLRAELGSTIPVACSQLARAATIENDLSSYRNKLMETEKAIQDIGIPEIRATEKWTQNHGPTAVPQVVAASAQANQERPIPSFLREELEKGYENGTIKANDIYVSGNAPPPIV